jgi:hypothetical protein
VVELEFIDTLSADPHKVPLQQNLISHTAGQSVLFSIPQSCRHACALTSFERVNNRKNENKNTTVFLVDFS